MNKKHNFFRFYISVITLLPLLFFTSKYAGLSKFIVPLYTIFVISMNYSYLNIDIESIQISKFELIEEIKNVLFSDKQPEKPKLTKEINESLARVKDFINIAKKDGSGSYPADFDYKGFIRDDESITHSKVPGDWGIDELYDFGKYSDLSRRKASASQVAVWLEYDYFVNQKRLVNLHGDDPTFNSSGTQWFKDYCNQTGTPLQGRNTWALRQNIRDIASGVR